MTMYQKPISVFLSYAQQDEQLLRELETHLSLLKQQGLISTWDARQIVPGTNRAEVIDEQFEQASIILLLVSADFLASNYCYQIEMKRALVRHEAGQASVIPIIVRSCDWRSAPFAHLQGLPTDAQPITSWLNKDEAWTNVAQSIRKAIANSTQSLPLVESSFERQPNFTTTFPIIWNVPYRHIDYFTGREQVLQRIREAFKTAGTTSPIVALGGPGGMGKTQTAAEYAYLYYADYKYVLWIKAESHATLTADFAAAADLLQLAEHNGRNVVRLMMEWLRTHSQWLLIFDNADDLAIVSDVLPKVGKGHILMTTRAAALRSLAKPILLEKLSAEAGAVFLLRRADIIDTTDSHEATTEEKYTVAQTISELLGGLPLALDQAGAYIEDTACNLPHYLKLYQTRSDEIRRMRFGPVPDYPEAVATTWTFSRTLVQENNPAAADLLRLCAFLYPEAIPEVIFTEGAAELGPLLAPFADDTMKLDLAIGGLRKYSLIARNPETETLSMHRLLQDVQRAELNQKEQRIWAERAVRAVYKTIKRPSPFPLHHAQHLRVQAQACVMLVKQWKMRFSEAALLEEWVEKQSW
jgi:hypothetical protein